MLIIAKHTRIEPIYAVYETVVSSTLEGRSFQGDNHSVHKFTFIYPREELGG